MKLKKKKKDYSKVGEERKEKKVTKQPRKANMKYER